MQLSACKSSRYTLLQSGVVIRGKVIDEETGEVMIGETVYEYSNLMNGTLTDINLRLFLKFNRSEII